MRCDFYSGVRPTRRRPANQQGQTEPLPFHLLRHMHHLVERWRDQSAQSDRISFFLSRCFQNFRGRNHHPKIENLIVVTLQDDANDVLSDIVHVAFHCRHDDAALSFCAR